jgi:uncharacterized protein
MNRAALLAVLLSAAPLASALDVPPLTGRVVDLADVLAPSTEAALVAQLAAYEDSTSNQVVVLTLPSLEGEVLEPYATRVFRTWGLGQADRDNGVLLLIAVEERELRIEVGYGLEGSLTDATAGTIIRSELVPRFRDGDFDAGVVAGVDAILGAIGGTYAPPRSPAGPDGVGLVLLLLVTLPIMIPGVLSSGGRNDVASRTLVISSVMVGLLAVFVGHALFGSILTGVAVGAGLMVAAVVLGALLGWALDLHPGVRTWRHHWQSKQAAFRRARARGASTVVVDGRSYSVPTSSSSGGFSGGGGSSGGGGASGSW